jgi:hypothetical protein
VLNQGEEKDIWEKLCQKNSIILELEKKGLDNLSKEDKEKRDKILSKNAIVVNGSSLDAGISDDL